MNLSKKTRENKEQENIKHKLILTIRMLDLSVKEKEEARLKLELIAEELRHKAKQLAITAKQLEILAKYKEEARLKLAVVAEELKKKAKQLEVVAKEKEETRLKLAIVANKLALTAKQLAITAKKLAIVAKEKELVRRKLAEVAKELETKAINQDKIQKELKESEVRYRRLFESAHDGILILDSNTAQITDVNPFLEKLLGYSKKEFLNKKLWEVGAFKNMKASKEAFSVLQNEGILRYDDLPLETKSGELIDVEFVSNTYMAGGVPVIQCNIRDITERKKIELIKETERSLKEERMKVASIADATHELRTPIAIIKGNIDLAKKNNGKYLKSPKSALKSIDFEVTRISNILSDLTLITSRGVELKNRIVFSNVDLPSLIREVVSRSKVLAFKKNISITFEKVPNIKIVGDEEYLKKMLTNLVKNTIIHGNKNGHTNIYTKISNGFISINVADDGIGIDTEDLSHVFERFYRADKSHNSDGNSIGLGLSIVKWVAEAHGGFVSVEKNTKGKGSIFTVSLPLKPSNS